MDAVIIYRDKRDDYGVIGVGVLDILWQWEGRVVRGWWGLEEYRAKIVCNFLLINVRFSSGKK